MRAQRVFNTHGAAGPSGIDADAWRWMCTAFSEASDLLCDALAASARRLATEHVDPVTLEAYVASKLIPLDKDPGVRPIGIGEVVRRIIGKAILALIRSDIQEAAGSLQLCAGQECGIEAAIHAMQQMFDQDDTEAVLMADATNAFNQLNREVCLHNLRHLCPSLATVVINTYRCSAKLFVGGSFIMSAEGTTQGDPLAMPMYAVAILPLIRSLSAAKATQLWYVDDSSAAGRIIRLRAWWDLLCQRGPLYGYKPNPSKSVLVVKPPHLEEASRIFESTGVTITDDGHRFLGAAIGTSGFVDGYLSQKAESWRKEVLTLAEIADSQPQAAFSAFTHGLKHRWSFLCRVMERAASALGTLEEAIASRLIPSLCGRSVGTVERKLLSFPCRNGGLGLLDPTALSGQYKASCTITAALVSKISCQDPALGDTLDTVRQTKRKLASDTRRATGRAATEFLLSLPSGLQHCMRLASEKGASSWLTCRPLKAHAFALSKGEFRDGLALRYGWTPSHLPTHCACGESFTICHALSCSRGGFPSLRHNEVRDVTASLLKRVAHSVVLEPHLQPITGESFRHRSAITNPQARLDIAASGVWGGRFDRTFFDVRVFNPFASSNRTTSVPSSYQRHEREKRRCYEERVCEVEHGSFCPVVLSTSGGMGKSATSLYKRIADMLSEKCQDPYSRVMAWIRCRVSFALLRACIACLRGARRPIFTPSVTAASVDLVVAEARLR